MSQNGRKRIAHVVIHKKNKTKNFCADLPSLKGFNSFVVQSAKELCTR